MVEKIIELSVRHKWVVFGVVLRRWAMAREPYAETQSSIGQSGLPGRAVSPARVRVADHDVRYRDVARTGRRGIAPARRANVTARWGRGL